MNIKKYTPRFLTEKYSIAIKNRKDIEFLLVETYAGGVKYTIPYPKNYINFFNHNTTVTFHNNTVVIHTILSPTILLIFLFIPPFTAIYLLLDLPDLRFQDIFTPLLIMIFSTYTLFIYLVESYLTSIREYIYRSIYIRNFNKYLGEKDC